MKESRKTELEILLHALKGSLESIEKDEIDLEVELSILEIIIEITKEI